MAHPMSEDTASNGVWLVHPTGNANVRALLRDFSATGILRRFHTTLGVGFDAREPLRSVFQQRSYPIPDKLLARRCIPELARLGLPAWSPRPSVDLVYRDLDRTVACILERLGSRANTGLPTVLYGYEDGCSAGFTVARELGIHRVYDLPIAYHTFTQEILQEEAERRPEWASTLPGLSDSPEKLERKHRELSLAETVVCPSQFVADSLPEWVSGDGERSVVVSPFGTPASSATRENQSPPRDPSRPLRVLFVGSLTQRKGLADLLDGVRLLGNHAVELVLLGSLLRPLEFYTKWGVPFRYEPPRSHDAVLALMETCDLLALPSLVEGRALVLQEAMSRGLPILITPNTGGADLVEFEKTGFLVPIRSPEAIASALAWCLDHRGDLPEMGRAAQRKAACLTWPAYAQRVREAILAWTSLTRNQG